MDYPNTAEPSYLSSANAAPHEQQQPMQWWRRIVLDEAFRHAVTVMSTRLVRSLEEGEAKREAASSSADGLRGELMGALAAAGVSLGGAAQSSGASEPSAGANAGGGASPSLLAKRKVADSVVGKLFAPVVVLERPVPTPAVPADVVRSAYGAFNEASSAAAHASAHHHNNTNASTVLKKRGTEGGSGGKYCGYTVTFADTLADSKTAASAAALGSSDAPRGGGPSPLLAYPSVALETIARGTESNGATTHHYRNLTASASSSSSSAATHTPASASRAVVLGTKVARFGHVALWRPHALPTYYVPLCAGNSAAVAADGRAALSAPLRAAVGLHAARRRRREVAAHGRANKFLKKLVADQRLAAGRRIASAAGPNTNARDSDSEADGDYAVGRGSFGMCVLCPEQRMYAVSESLFSPAMATESMLSVAARGAAGDVGAATTIQGGADAASNTIGDKGGTRSAFLRLQMRRAQRRDAARQRRRAEGINSSSSSTSSSGDEGEGSEAGTRPHRPSGSSEGKSANTFGAPSTEAETEAAAPLPVADIFPPAGFVVEHSSRTDVYAPHAVSAGLIPHRRSDAPAIAGPETFVVGAPVAGALLAAAAASVGSAVIATNKAGVGASPRGSQKQQSVAASESEASGVGARDNPPLPLLAVAGHSFCGASAEGDWLLAAASREQRDALYSAAYAFLKDAATSLGGEGAGPGNSNSQPQSGGAAATTSSSTVSASSAAAANVARLRPSAFSNAALAQAMAISDAAAASTAPTVVSNNNAVADTSHAVGIPSPASALTVSVPAEILMRRCEEVAMALWRTFRPQPRSLLDYSRPPQPQRSAAASSSSSGKTTTRRRYNNYSSIHGCHTSTTNSPILSSPFLFAQQVYERPVAVVAIRKTPRELMRGEAMVRNSSSNGANGPSFGADDAAAATPLIGGRGGMKSGSGKDGARLQAEIAEESAIQRAIGGHAAAPPVTGGSHSLGAASAQTANADPSSSSSSLPLHRYASIDVPITIGHVQCPLPLRYLGTVRPSMRLVRWRVLSEAIHRCYREEQWRAGQEKGQGQERRGGGSGTEGGTFIHTHNTSPNAPLSSLKSGKQRVAFYEQFIGAIPDVSALLLEGANDRLRGAAGSSVADVCTPPSSSSSSFTTTGSNNGDGGGLLGGVLRAPFAITRPSTLPLLSATANNGSSSTAITATGGQPASAASVLIGKKGRRDRKGRVVVDGRLLPPTSCGIPNASFLGLDRRDLTVARHDALYRSPQCRAALRRLFAAVEKDPSDGHVSQRGFVEFVLDLCHLFMPCGRREVNILTAEDEWAIFNKRWESSSSGNSHGGGDCGEKKRSGSATAAGGRLPSPPPRQRQHSTDANFFGASLSPRTAYDMQPATAAERALLAQQQQQQTQSGDIANTNSTRKGTQSSSGGGGATTDGPFVSRFRDEERERAKGLEALSRWMDGRSAAEGGSSSSSAATAAGGGGSAGGIDNIDHETLFHCGNMAYAGHTVMYLPPSAAPSQSNSTGVSKRSTASASSITPTAASLASAAASSGGGSGDFSHFYNFFFSFPLMLCQGEVVTEALYVSVWEFVAECLGIAAPPQSANASLSQPQSVDVSTLMFAASEENAAALPSPPSPSSQSLTVAPRTPHNNSRCCWSSQCGSLRRVFDQP